jgi:hypothetical protein
VTTVETVLRDRDDLLVRLKMRPHEGSDPVLAARFEPLPRTQRVVCVTRPISHSQLPELNCALCQAVTESGLSDAEIQVGARDVR